MAAPVTPTPVRDRNALGTVIPVFPGDESRDLPLMDRLGISMLTNLMEDSGADITIIPPKFFRALLDQYPQMFYDRIQPMDISPPIAGSTRCQVVAKVRLHLQLMGAMFPQGLLLENVVCYVPSDTFVGESILLGNDLMTQVGYPTFMKFLASTAKPKNGILTVQDLATSADSPDAVQLNRVTTMNNVNFTPPMNDGIKDLGIHVDICKKPLASVDFDKALTDKVDEAVAAGMPAEFAAEALELMDEYRDVFATAMTDEMGVTGLPDWVDIPATGLKFSGSKAHLRRNLSPMLKAGLGKVYDKLVSQGLATAWDGKVPANVEVVEYAVPMLVRKKANEFRCVFDLRAYNKVVQGVLCSNMTQEDIECILSPHKFFANLDFISWFFQNRRRHEKVLLVLHFPDGRQCIPQVMMQGELNSTTCSNANVTAAFAPFMEDKSIAIVVDDVATGAKTIPALLTRVRGLFDRCRLHNIKLNLKKFMLCTTRLHFAGRIFEDGCVKVDPARISGLTSLRVPDTLAELVMFLGSTQWLGTHLPRFNQVAHPLHQLKKTLMATLKRPTKQNTSRVRLETHWTVDHSHAFQKVKDMIAHAVDRHVPNDEDQLLLFSDACDTGWSFAVVSCAPSEMEKPVLDRDIRLVGFYGGLFQGSELNYDLPNKEILAALNGLERASYWIYRRSGCILYTDHKNMAQVLSATLTSSNRVFASRIERWGIRCSSYPVIVCHIPGEDNILADMGSRLTAKPLLANRISLNSFWGDEQSKIKIRNLQAAPVDPTEDEDDKDPDEPVTINWKGHDYQYGKSFGYGEIDPRAILTTKRRRRQVVKEKNHPKPEHPPREHSRRHALVNSEEETVENTQEDDEDEPVVSDQELPDELPQYDNIENVRSTLPVIADNDMILPPVEELCEIQIHFGVNEKKNLIQDDVGLYRHKSKIWIPEHQQTKLRIMASAHVVNGRHRSLRETMEIMTRYFHWPKMKEDLTKFIKGCINCACKRADRLTKTTFGTTQLSTYPNQRLHMDFASVHGRKHGGLFPDALIMKDGMTKLLLIHPCYGATAENAINGLMTWIAIYGIPKEVVSDQGSHFANYVLSETCRRLKIAKMTTVPNAPHTNGISETGVKQFKGALRDILTHCQLHVTKWYDVLSNILYTLNNLPRKSLDDHSPRELWGFTKELDAFDVYYDRDKQRLQSIDLKDENIAAYVDQLRLFLDDLWTRAVAETEKAREVSRRHANRNREALDLNVGDLVLELTIPRKGKKSLYKWQGPRRVVDATHSSTYEIEDLLTGKRRVVHAQRLYPYDDRLLNIGEDVKQLFMYQHFAYAIHDIVGHRWEGGSLEFEVTFAGFDDDENSNSFELGTVLQKTAASKIRRYINGLKLNNPGEAKRLMRTLGM